MGITEVVRAIETLEEDARRVLANSNLTPFESRVKRPFS